MNTPLQQTEALPAAFIRQLQDIFGAQQVLTDPADCWAYGYDNSKQQALPQAVVFADRHEQVVKLVTLCNEYQTPLTPRGRGTGTTGATVPILGGVVLSLERMKRIIDIDAGNRIARVEPGVTNQELQDRLAEQGFFWPPDPTSAATCTIGGNLAYNSAGPRAVKYGTPRENTLGLRAVTGAGEEIRTGVMTTKGVVGYDLTRLLIGSEGTLAIITEATLKLTPLAEEKRTLQAVYRDIHSAAKAVSNIMAQPVTPYALEFIDGNAINMVRRFSSLDLPEQADTVLLIEVDGSRAAIDEAARQIAVAANIEGCISVQIAADKRQVTKLWQVRKALSPALRNVAPKKINEDVVVPVSRIPDLIEGLDKLSRESGITIVNFGHAGNGNIHVNLLINPDDPAQLSAKDDCLSAVFDLVLKLDGTLSGEHGIGLVKRDYISRELDPATLRLMRGIRKEFDPNNILNEGKTLPDN